MEYGVRLYGVNNPESKVKAFADVNFGNCFKVTNVAVVEGKEGQVFVSMPRYRSSERTENNEPVYKDICNPISAEFRQELYQDILRLYEEMVDLGMPEIARVIFSTDAPEFSVAVTPYEREGSNILGLARIYFEEHFVVGNVSILQGKEGEFIAMPSHKTGKTNKEGKAEYKDVCFPVTKQFRVKLYGAIKECYQLELEKNRSKGMAAEQGVNRASQNRQQYQANR